MCIACVYRVYSLFGQLCFDVLEHIKMDDGSQNERFLGNSNLRTYANICEKLRITFIYWHWKMVSIFILFFFKLVCVCVVFVVVVVCFHFSMPNGAGLPYYTNHSVLLFTIHHHQPMPWLVSTWEMKILYIYFIFTAYGHTRCTDFLTIWDMRHTTYTQPLCQYIHILHKFQYKFCIRILIVRSSYRSNGPKVLLLLMAVLKCSNNRFSIHFQVNAIALFHRYHSNMYIYMYNERETCKSTFPFWFNHFHMSNIRKDVFACLKYAL